MHVSTYGETLSMPLLDSVFRNADIHMHTLTTVACKLKHALQCRSLSCLGWLLTCLGCLSNRDSFLGSCFLLVELFLGSLLVLVRYVCIVYLPLQHLHHTTACIMSTESLFQQYLTEMPSCSAVNVYRTGIQGCRKSVEHRTKLALTHSDICFE